MKSDKRKFNKGKYDAAYIRERVIAKRVLFNKGNEEDMRLLEHAESGGNFNGYIKGLIRRDLEAEGKQEDPAPGKQG